MNTNSIKRFLRLIIFSSVVILGLSLLQISCADSISAGKMEFEKNRQIWKKSGIKDYKMKVVIGASGHGAPSGEYIITVRRGKTVSMVSPESPSNDFSDYWGFDPYNNLDKIFTIIENFFDSDSKNKELEQLLFDPKLGYPIKVRFSFDTVELHGGFSFEVLEFEILK